MPTQQLKGLLVSGDTRNTKVVTVLIAAMTVGALILLSLESLQPRTPTWSADTLLLAERGDRVEDVLIEFVPDEQSRSLAEFDCVIYPDGLCDWRPRGPHVRLAVVGPGAERLAASQARSLLVALGIMNQTRGLDLARVRLQPGQEPRQEFELSPAARDLGALLARKGIVP